MAKTMIVGSVELHPATLRITWTVDPVGDGVLPIHCRDIHCRDEEELRRTVLQYRKARYEVSVIPNYHFEGVQFYAE